MPQASNNPIPPAHPQVLILAGLEKAPKEYTFREAVEWHKRAVRWFLQEGRDALPQESAALQESWSHLISGIAERENIPAGFLSYALDLLAQNELAMAASAETEYEQQASTAEAITEALKAEQ